MAGVRPSALLVGAGLFGVAADWYGFAVTDYAFGYYIASVVVTSALVLLGLRWNVAAWVLLVLSLMTTLFQLAPPRNERVPVLLLSGIGTVLTAMFLKRSRDLKRSSADPDVPFAS